MTEQIQRIVEGAPVHFLSDPFVRAYLQQAQLRMAVQSNNP